MIFDWNEFITETISIKVTLKHDFWFKKISTGNPFLPVYGYAFFANYEKHFCQAKYVHRMYN